MKIKNAWLDDYTGRVLHAGFAIAIVCQLLSSYVMHRPYLGRHLSLLPEEAFLVHKFVGLVAFGFVVVYWCWVLTGRRDKLKHLFSWITSLGRMQIKSDVFSLLRGRLPEHPDGGGLAGTIHGLGLLLVTLVGFCGLLLFLFLPQTHQMPEGVHFIKETHANFAYWIWWYVIGHSAMAFWHYWKKRQHPPERRGG